MTQPTFVIADFRANFPEFVSTSVYPDAMITFWSGLAQQQVRYCAWGTVWLQGVSLYTAHELVMAAQNVKAAGSGLAPGQSGGIANTKAVGAVNVGYDTVSSAEKDAGFWNLTNYGKQFIRLARLFGAGAIQL